MTCAICQEPLTTPYSLPCGHSFNASCLFLASINGHRCCPICRAPFRENDPESDSEEMMQEDDDRRFARAIRLYRQGKAPPELSALVERHLADTESLKENMRAFELTRRVARKYKQRIERAARSILRESPTDIRAILHTSILISPQSPEFETLDFEAYRSRIAVIDAV